MKDPSAKEMIKTVVISVFLLSSMLLNLQLLQPDGDGLAGAQLDSGALQDVVEARIVELEPSSYLPFLVEYNGGDLPAQAWCKASLRAEELYRDGVMGVGDSVLAAVDPETRTGVVIDSIADTPLEKPTGPAEEPQPVEPEEPEEPAPEPEPVPEPDDGEEEPAVEPEEPAPEPEPDDGEEEPAPEPEEPEPSVELPAGFELVSSEPGPTPGVAAPEGKVKLTVMTQPMGLQGVTVYPPPGVYFVNVYSVVTFSCVSEDPGWEFSNWTISRGVLGVRYNEGLGYDHLLRWRVDVDTVVTAYHTELV
jgi:hypothetical protein